MSSFVVVLGSVGGCVVSDDILIIIICFCFGRMWQLMDLIDAESLV